MEQSEDVVYMFRHGEVDNNLHPEYFHGQLNHVELNERGEEQAYKLGRWLVEHDIMPARVYSSPAVRARRTAEITLEAMGIWLPITEDDRLQEIDRGEWTGRLRSEVITPAVERDILRLGKDYATPGGESFNQVGARKLKALEDMTEPGLTFVFSHGMSTRCLAGTLHGWPAPRVLREKTPNTGMTRFGRANTRWQLDRLPNGQLWLGQKPHLTD